MTNPLSFLCYSVMLFMCHHHHLLIASSFTHASCLFYSHIIYLHNTQLPLSNTPTYYSVDDITVFVLLSNTCTFYTSTSYVSAITSVVLYYPASHAIHFTEHIQLLLVLHYSHLVSPTDLRNTVIITIAPTELP